jgi:hypothetical protein
MALLREQMNFEKAKLVFEQDASGTGKSLYMKGIFIQGGVKNHNHRVYPVHEIRRAVDQINDMIREGSVLGEIDHPEELNINLDRVSHMITEMYMDGPNGIGKLKILSTPMGQIARAMIEDGVKLGVSSRGSGDVGSNGEVSNFDIVTIDIVARPSAPASFPRPMYESMNARRGAIIEDLARAAVNDVKAQKFLRDELIGFINSLK